MRASTRVFLVFLLIMAVAISSCSGSAGPKNPPPGSSMPNGSLAQAENPTPMIISGGDDSSGGTSPGGTILPLKPVCFLNTGTIAATVMAWSFIPLDSESPATPSDASTVAFPGGNPSACLSLPLGTYTWCYHWELGDLDGDLYIDYAHAFDTYPVLLDESDFDSLDLAEKVSLSVPPGSYEYPGQCDLGIVVIRWGDEFTEWSVQVEGGIVVGGSIQGEDIFNWTATGGTFDGSSLYVQYHTDDAEGCKNTLEAWWQVTPATVSSIRVLTGCGTENLEVHTFQRME